MVLSQRNCNQIKLSKLKHDGIKWYVFTFCLHVCSRVKTSSLQYIKNVVAMTQPIPLAYYVMVLITFLLPSTPSLVSCLTRLKKVPMMHGATTSTVSSATTPVTNVPFAESATSNQVCPFILAFPFFTAVRQLWSIVDNGKVSLKSISNQNTIRKVVILVIV